MTPGGPTSGGKKRLRLSATQLLMYLRCPRQYAYRYVEGRKRPPSGAMLQGRVFHETLERNYRQKITSDEDLAVADLLDFFSTRFDDAFRTHSETDDSTRASLKDSGVGLISAHSQWIAPQVRPMWVERSFSFALPRGIDAEFVGIWDLVEKNGTVVDHKTYRRSPTQNDVDKNLQLSSYALAYRNAVDTDEVDLRLDAVIKTKTPKVAQLSTRRTREDDRWLIDLIAGIARGIQGEHFVPNPTGWHCSKSQCGYFDICMKGTRAVFTPTIHGDS